MSASGAQRTCVACRETGDRSDLLRLVAAPDGTVVFDRRGKLPGRGAWVCASASCVDALGSKPGLLARAFRGRMSAAELPQQIRSTIAQDCLDAVSLEAARGALVVGQDMIIEALGLGHVAAVLMASDTAERTAKRINEAAGERALVVTGPWTQEELGARVGQSFRAAVGVRGGSGSAHVVLRLRRLHCLS